MKPLVSLLQCGILKDILKLEKFKTDHGIFQLHFRLSTLIVLGSFLFYIFTISPFGPMNCYDEKGNYAGENINLGCWAMGTFSVEPEDYSDANTGQTKNIMFNYSFAKPALLGITQRSKVRYHGYYQWMPFICVGQFIMFIFPRYLWRCIEDGKIKMLCRPQKEANIKSKLFANHRPVRRQLKRMAEYIVGQLGSNNLYGFGFAACEVLNLIMVVSQMTFFDAMSGYAFSEYGFHAGAYIMDDRVDRVDAFLRRFPGRVGCTLAMYGPSGNIVPFDIVCSMPMNVITKVYIISMWFHLYGLFGLDIANLAFRLTTIASLTIRRKLFRNTAVTTCEHVMNRVFAKCLYGDWFIFMLLSQNVESAVFQELMEHIDTEISKQELGLASQRQRASVAFIAADPRPKRLRGKMDNVSISFGI